MCCVRWPSLVKTALRAHACCPAISGALQVLFLCWKTSKKYCQLLWFGGGQETWRALQGRIPAGRILPLHWWHVWGSHGGRGLCGCAGLGPKCTSLIPPCAYSSSSISAPLSAPVTPPAIALTEKENLVLPAVSELVTARPKETHELLYRMKHLYISRRFRFDVPVCFAHLCDRRLARAIFDVTSIQEIPRAFLVFVWGWQAEVLQVGAHRGCLCLSLLLKFISTFTSTHTFQLKAAVEQLFGSIKGWEQTLPTCLNSEMSLIVLHLMFLSVISSNLMKFL